MSMSAAKLQQKVQAQNGRILPSRATCSTRNRSHISGSESACFLEIKSDRKRAEEHNDNTPKCVGSMAAPHKGDEKVQKQSERNSPNGHRVEIHVV